EARQQSLTRSEAAVVVALQRPTVLKRWSGAPVDIASHGSRRLGEVKELVFQPFMRCALHPAPLSEMRTPWSAQVAYWRVVHLPGKKKKKNLDDRNKNDVVRLGKQFAMTAWAAYFWNATLFGAAER